MLVPTLSHSTGHSEVEQLAGRNCGVAAVCTLEWRGIKCSSAADEGKAGVMDGPGEWTFGVLPISWEIGGSEKTVRERVSPTGIGPATFATDLGILAIQGFEDMKEQARDTMI